MKNNCAGLSIVEALVTMVILMITLGGVYQIFQSNSLTYRMQEGLSRVQENGRFAMDFLVNDIRMAGYRGCNHHGPLNSTLKLSTVSSTDLWIYNFNVGLEGYNNVTSTFTDLGVLSIIPNTDIIVIRRDNGDSVGIVKNNNSSQLFAEVKSEEPGACGTNKPRISGICEGDILMVTDCRKSRVFQAGNIQIASGSLNITHPSSGNPGNDPTSWGGANAPEEERFGSDAEIVKITTILYYIRQQVVNSGRTPSLYRKFGIENAQELVEGIENMQFLYGTGSGIDFSVVEYVDASLVQNWNEVRSVKIGLLVSTVDEIPGLEIDTNVYSVLDESVGPMNDKRIRKVFSTTVGIRNKLK